jgi:hypothetical protein
MPVLDVYPRRLWSPFRSRTGAVPPRGGRRDQQRAATATATAAVIESLERRALLSSTSIWPADAAPATPDVADSASVEVGVRFRSDGDGNITGIRFYKGAADTAPDTYVVNLWTNSGTLLGTATMDGSAATGWQQVDFASPVHITAGTTYVASYFAPEGNYADTNNYFTIGGYDNAPLHALMDGVDGGNGVFQYGAASAFPGNSFSSTNYWVDVVYDDTGVAPKVFAVSPANGATAASVNGNVSVTFSKAMDATTINASTVQLLNASNAVVPATVTYNAATGRATIAPSTPLAADSNYTVRVTTGAKDSTGLALAANFSSSFHTAAGTTASVSLWDDSVTPANPDFPDGNPVELGVRFVSSEAGSVAGIRFYKGSIGTYTYNVDLWNADGTQRLATGTLTGSAATGWVEVDFDTPVDITAGTQYVAAYHVPAGVGYAVDANYFGATPYSNGPLTVVNSVDSNGGNAGAGSFTYSDGSVFPATPTTSNYWVSPVFVETSSGGGSGGGGGTTPNQAPVAADQSASVNEDGSVGLSLAATDDTTAAGQLTFTVVSLPTLGLLTFNGIAVTAGQTFTGSPSNLVYTPGVETEGGVSDSFTYTATDNDATPLTSAAATVSIAINKAVADGAVVLGSDGVLRIGGTVGNDVITVYRGSDGKYRILRGTTLVSSSIPVSSVYEIRVWGRGGNDVITVADSTVKTFLSGGLGNDILTGGFGGTVQVGGAGDDLLTGGSGNDVLVGGSGNDAMFGLAGDDVLIAGSLSGATSLAGLRAMSAEWVASHATTAQEAADADQVVTDTTTDVLSGGTGSDWFILSKGDVVRDATTLHGSKDVLTYVT